jgi:hypothetical protein
MFVNRLPKSVTVEKCVFSLISVRVCYECAMYTHNLYILNILWCSYRTNCHKINTDDGCIFQVAYIVFMNEHTHTHTHTCRIYSEC